RLKVLRFDETVESAGVVAEEPGHLVIGDAGFADPPIDVLAGMGPRADVVGIVAAPQEVVDADDRPGVYGRSIGQDGEKHVLPEDVSRWTVDPAVGRPANQAPAMGC